MQEDLCRHDLHPTTCSFCTGRDTTRPPEPKLRVSANTPKAPVDDDLLVAQLVAEGRMCPSCLTTYAPIGCGCSRRETYDTFVDDAQAWLLERADELTLTPKEASHLALATRKRAGRRAGLTPDEAQSDRLDAYEAFEIVPNWHRYRRQEADVLPV